MGQKQIVNDLGQRTTILLNMLLEIFVEFYTFYFRFKAGIVYSMIGKGVQKQREIYGSFPGKIF